jgi:hypothetical protein
MRPILSDIRALPGVTGVAVIAKRDGRIEHLFPAAFTERHTEHLLKLVTATYQRLHGFTRLSLRFERVVVHLFNQPEYLLLVTLLPDVDPRHLESVVNAKLEVIAHALAKESAVTGRPAVGSVHDPFGIMVTVCSTLSDMMADGRGRVRLATDWRHARDQADGGRGLLAALVIDAAGHLGIRKGQTLTAGSETVAALAAMIDNFLERLGTQRTAAEEELYALMEPHRALLEPAGFYLYLTASGRRAPARRT